MSATLTPEPTTDAGQEPVERDRRSLWTRIRTYSPDKQFLPVIATFAVFLGMFGVGEWRYDGFADPQVFLNLLLDNSFLVLLAVGMTFVILTGGIDLSVGSVVALSGTIAATTLEAGWSPYLVVVTVLAVGTTLGLLMGLLIHYFDIQPFIATLAGLFLARGIAYLITTESIPIREQKFVDWSLASVTLPLPMGVGTIIVVALVAFAALGYVGMGDRFLGNLFLTGAAGIALVTYGLRYYNWWYYGYEVDYFLTWTGTLGLFAVAVAAFVLARTRFGRTVYAIGGNESSAMLMGLRVAVVKVGVYAVSGFCAAAGGILYSLYLLSGGYTQVGIGMELDAIAAVVIGGTLLTGGRGLVVGSLVGVLVLGAIQAFIVFDGTLSPSWTRISIGLLVLVFVVVQRLLTRRQA
jgi:ribose/xylose/arabinose/galactoside ABC-type transport system permease subunit